MSAINRSLCSPSFNPCEGFGGFATIFVPFDRNKPSSFNPCEGFGGFATSTPQNSRRGYRSFNPCEGFGGFATEQQRRLKSELEVSIPVRDSGVLRLASR